MKFKLVLCREISFSRDRYDVKKWDTAAEVENGKIYNDLVDK